MTVIKQIYKNIHKSREIKRALFISELGLGDHIDMIGAVRYFCNVYDQIHIACYGRNIKTLTEFYSDNPKVTFLDIENDSWFKNVWKDVVYYRDFKYIPPDYVVVLRSGYYINNSASIDYDIPNSYYRDLGLDISINQSYFYIPENLQSKELYETVKDMRYIFVQQKSSEHFTPLVTWDINETFTIEPNINLYPKDHQWYQLANNFVNKPFPHYVDTLTHASEFYIVNSSFRCLAAHIPLEATVKKCFDRYTGKHIPEWTFNRYNPTSPSQ